ncbi:MAG: hypothetical protein WCT03_26015, partial [Candidatus Obscuribacterales bacterium]
MALRNSRTKIVSALLATTFTLQSNLACLAAPALLDANLQTQSAEDVAIHNAIDPVATDLVETPESAEAFAIGETGAALTDTALSETSDSKSDSNTKIAYGNFTLDGPLSNPATTEDNASTNAETDAASGTTDLSRSKAPQLLSEAPILAQSPTAEQFTLSGGASVTPEESVDKIDDLTKQILLKEIELQKFNLHYSQEVAKQGRWKGWRYAALQEVNMGTGLAGAIISVANRGSYLHRAAG